MNIEKLAAIVDDAASNAMAVEQLTIQQPFSVDDAYAIQNASLKRRYARGERLIGLKLGFTSKAKMEQMGVHDMIWGRLTDQMLLAQPAQLALSGFIHPRAEPEICFLVKKKIDRPISLQEAPDFIEGIAAAIEIIDSRYQNFKFSLEDVIADNCSSAGLVIGAWHSPATDISNLKIDLLIDDALVQTGSSAAILGNPWESVVAAARLAHQYEEEINVGHYLMAGAATPAMYLKTGQKVVARVEQLGEVNLGIL